MKKLILALMLLAASTASAFDPVQPVKKGGTSRATLPSGQLLYGAGTNPVSSSTALTFSGTKLHVGTPADSGVVTSLEVAGPAGEYSGLFRSTRNAGNTYSVGLLTRSAAPNDGTGTPFLIQKSDGTDLVSVSDTGQIRATGLSNNGGTGTSSFPVIAAGTFTPSACTGARFVAVSSMPQIAHGNWGRIGNQVFGSFALTVRWDGTASFGSCVMSSVAGIAPSTGGISGYGTFHGNCNDDTADGAKAPHYILYNSNTSGFTIESAGNNYTAQDYHLFCDFSFTAN